MSDSADHHRTQHQANAERQPLAMRGRGAQSQPDNRFETIRFQADWSELEDDEATGNARRRLATEYFIDQTESIVSENNSPDLPFRWSVNPYRGCVHGCSYCYARPTHEYLGWSAGLDFETKILVKPRAAELFRDWLSRDQHGGAPVMFSGVTDCYQPIEETMTLTRQCLGVAAEARQAVMIVTKNARITRDLALLQTFAQDRLVQVAISIPTLDPDLARIMEPRASTPEARLRTIGQLSAAQIPVSVLIAPIIPGLTDFEIPRILEAAANAGAQHAGKVLLRLPLTVRPVFLEWLQQARPLAYERVAARIQDTRGGQWYDADFGSRQRGQGLLADQIHQTFRLFATRYGLAGPNEPLDTEKFLPPRSSSGQGRLF